MKNMFEYMTTMIITMILVFVFTSIISIGSQMLNARLIHSAAIEKFESSYYTYDLNDLLNTEELNGWSFTCQELNAVKTRRDFLITLNYKINLPLFDTKFDGQLKGYAR